MFGLAKSMAISHVKGEPAMGSRAAAAARGMPRMVHTPISIPRADSCAASGPKPAPPAAEGYSSARG